MASVTDYVAMAVIVAAGSIVQAVLGFGGSIVWMGFFPFFTSSIQVAVGVLQPIAHTLNALVLSRVWKSAMNPFSSALLPLAVAIPVGIILGIWIITTWSPPSINGLLGIFIMLYVWHNRDEFAKRPIINRDDSMHTNSSDSSVEESVAAVELVHLEPSKVSHNDKEDFERDEATAAQSADDQINNENTLVPSTNSHQYLPNNSNLLKSMIAGLFGGCLTSAFGTGGPPILIYAREAGWDKIDPDCFRANLQTIFFYWNTITNVSLFYKNVITYETLETSAILIPAMIVGGVFGSSIASRINKDVFKKMVLVALAIMGVLYIIRALEEFSSNSR